MSKNLITEQRIKDALVTLLLLKPFHKITITDLTTTANINRSTYYYHYYRKEEVLKEVMDEAIGDLISKMENSTLNQRNYEIDQSILPSTKELFNHIFKYRHYYKSLLQSDVSYTFENKFIKALKQYVNNIQIDFGGDDNFVIDHKLYTNYQAYTILGFIKHWIDTEFEESPIYLSEQLTSLLHVKVNSVSFTRKLK